MLLVMVDCFEQQIIVFIDLAVVVLGWLLNFKAILGFLTLVLGRFDGLIWLVMLQLLVFWRDLFLCCCQYLVLVVRVCVWVYFLGLLTRNWFILVEVDLRVLVHLPIRWFTEHSSLSHLCLVYHFPPSFSFLRIRDFERQLGGHRWLAQWWVFGRLSLDTLGWTLQI